MTCLLYTSEKHYLELVETKAEILKGENLGVTLIIAPIRNMSANHKMYVNEDGSTYYGCLLYTSRCV